MKDQTLKKDSGKAPLDLLPFRAILSVSLVQQFGAEKYERHGWRRGMEWCRMLAAALRHLFAWALGEDRDPESGLPHLAHAACCVLYLLEYTIERVGTDDRYTPGALMNAINDEATRSETHWRERRPDDWRTRFNEQSQKSVQQTKNEIVALGRRLKPISGCGCDLCRINQITNEGALNGAHIIPFRHQSGSGMVGGTTAA
jgi:hypothetical protein